MRIATPRGAGRLAAGGACSPPAARRATTRRRPPRRAPAPEEGALRRRSSTSTARRRSRAAPERVVVAGLREQDALLALGIVPVATTEWFGTRPGEVFPGRETSWATRGCRGARLRRRPPVRENRRAAPGPDRRRLLRADEAGVRDAVEDRADDRPAARPDRLGLVVAGRDRDGRRGGRQARESAAAAGRGRGADRQSGRGPPGVQRADGRAGDPVPGDLRLRPGRRAFADSSSTSASSIPRR